jgi:hypothetical protein
MNLVILLDDDVVALAGGIILAFQRLDIVGGCFGGVSCLYHGLIVTS